MEEDEERAGFLQEIKKGAASGLEQNLADEDLDYLSALLGSRSDLDNLLEADDDSQSITEDDSTGMSSEMASTHIRQLVTFKKTVYDLLQDNESYIDSLEKAIYASKKAGQDLDAMEECLKRAELAEREDETFDILSVHAEMVELSLYPEIHRRIPLLASQSSEIDQLRLLVGNYSWSSDEVIKLKRCVLNQCLRIGTLRLAESDDCPENLLDIAAKWSEEELSQVSLPFADGLDEDIIWRDVSIQIGSTHTAEECRTRWLMVDRPGLKQEKWTEEETNQLKEIINQELKDGVIHDWQAVAKKVNTGRLAIECFSQSQQMDLIPLYASYSAQAWSKEPLSRDEQDDLQQLSSIWDNQSIIAARLTSSRPRDQVPISLMPSTKPIRTVRWSGRADNALIVHVAKECRMKRSKMFENIDSLGPINFANEYRRRPIGASARMVKARWNLIKSEYKRDPSKYLAVSSTLT